MYGGPPTRVTAVTRESLSNKYVHTVTMFCYRSIGPCQLHDVADQPLQMSRLKFIS